ncbi:NDP-sugar synthase [Gracilimonas sp.]|uniref:nucleotidyltransferase family protein n=1 Tax=Gracilimonas sp. TaxID=1974203 RepID=UPI00287130B9|nr:sugar phosphate nucleotidyltransferase [Gracilimonas sp.]
MPSLVILAAGMGSRYGGTKQFSTFGPHDHLIMDYTIYDAVKAGFNKVVCVIREEIEAEFNTVLQEKWQDQINIVSVFQELDALPDEFEVPEERTKPWGTAHALWMAEPEIDEPFAMVNADDFYGRGAIQKAYNKLIMMDKNENNAFIIGYEVGNTLSPHGSVSRGLCNIDGKGHLKEIKELKSIERKNGTIVSETNSEQRELNPDDLVSMNLMGFTPFVFESVREGFHEFYQNLSPGSNAEFYLAEVLSILMDKGVQISVIPTNSEWFGVTYSEDNNWVNQKLEELHESWVYPDEF